MIVKTFYNNKSYDFQCWENNHWSKLPSYLSTMLKNIFHLRGSLERGYITNGENISKIETLIITYSLINWYNDHLIRKAKMIGDIYIERDVSGSIEHNRDNLLAILSVKSEHSSLSKKYYFRTLFYLIAKNLVISEKMLGEDEDVTNHDESDDWYWYQKIRNINEKVLYDYFKNKLFEIAQKNDLQIVEFPSKYVMKEIVEK